jgi:glycosyltransferase involved in cell wall biosynthesis
VRILIASHYTSEAMGGEAAIPLRLFDRLRGHGVDAWLVAHDGDRTELTERFADCPDRLILTRGWRSLSQVFTFGQKLPDGLRSVAWGITQVERQQAMVGEIRRLVRELSIDVVHQPIGIAPNMPSPLTRLGAPLVVGPLNGGLSMPPAFRARESRTARIVQTARRPVGHAAHQVLRGKLEASVVLAANEHTRALLPKPALTRSRIMPESAVIFDDWPAKDRGAGAGAGAGAGGAGGAGGLDGVGRVDGVGGVRSPNAAGVVDPAPIRFVYLGRLVAYKSPDLLLEGFVQFARSARTVDARLEIIGDGPMRTELEAEAGRLGVTDRVTFAGWLSKSDASARLRASDVFVHPSLREPGGTSVLEAMATGLPCIVADWGGPAEYVQDGTGIRISVASREAFVGNIADAMAQLATNPQLRSDMGAKARARVAEYYDWDVLTAQLVKIYQELMDSRARP